MAANSSAGIYLQRRSVRLPDPGSAEKPGGNAADVNQRLADSSVPLSSAFVSKEVFIFTPKKIKKEKCRTILEKVSRVFDIYPNFSLDYKYPESLFRLSLWVFVEAIRATCTHTHDKKR